MRSEAFLVAHNEARLGTEYTCVGPHPCWWRANNKFFPLPVQLFYWLSTKQGAARPMYTLEVQLTCES